MPIGQPAAGYTPTGIGAGMAYQQQTDQFNQQFNMEQALQELQRRKQLQDLQESLMTQQGRVGATNAKNQADIEYAVKDRMQKAQADAIKNEIAGRTKESSIGAANAGNEAAVQKSNLEKLEALTDEMNSASNAWQGPTASAQADAWLESKGMKPDHPVRQRVAQAKSPEEVQNIVASTRNALTNKISSMRKRIEEQSKAEAEGVFKIEGHNIDAASRERVANIGAGATMEAARLRAATEKAMNPGQALVNAQRIASKIPPNKDPKDFSEDETMAMYTIDNDLGSKLTKAEQTFDTMAAIVPELGKNRDKTLANARKQLEESAPTPYRKWKRAQGSSVQTDQDLLDKYAPKGK